MWMQGEGLLTQGMGLIAAASPDALESVDPAERSARIDDKFGI